MAKLNERFKLAVVFCLVAVVLILSGCAPAPQADPAKPMEPAEFITSTIWYFLLMLFVVYLFILRPTTQKDEGRKKFLENLKKNDEVVTTGGIFGRVVSVQKEHITVEVAQGVRLKVQPIHVQAVTVEGGKEKGSQSDEKKGDDKKN